MHLSAGAQATSGRSSDPAASAQPIDPAAASASERSFVELAAAWLPVAASPDTEVDPLDLRTEYAAEITYEGLYELAEETVADGTSTLLDEHFGALGGWIAATLVKLGDLPLAFHPADDDS